MEKLSPSVRLAMLQSAKDCYSKTTRWNLQRLAAMNDGEPRTATPLPSPIIAQTLLNEVKYRLASQHKKCTEMVQQILGENTESIRNTSPMDSSSSKKVVKALNQHVALGTMKERMAEKKALEKELKDARLGIKGLEVLHANTFELVHDLLTPDRNVIERFSQADKDLVAATFEQIRSRHASTVETLADSVIGLLRVKSASHNLGIMELERSCEPFLDSNLVMSFLKDRLGIQLLCDHYVGLNKGKSGGGISVSNDFTDVLTDAILESKHICDANLGLSPEVHILESHLTQEQTRLTFVKPWVHHTLVELLKNGMASSVQKSLNSGLKVPVPDIYISITSEGERDDILACHVFDQGIGLGKESPHKAFEFAKSTSLKRWDRLDEQQSYAMVRAPLGSLGVGLTMSQIMMQSFGGDIQLKNRGFGHVPKETRKPLDPGCTATLLLPRDDTIEGF